MNYYGTSTCNNGKPAIPWNRGHTFTSCNLYIIHSVGFPKRSGLHNCQRVQPVVGNTAQASSDVLGDAQFGTQSNHRLCGVFVVFFRTTREFLAQYLKSDHDHFLLRHFRFITHHHPIKLKELCTLSTKCIHVFGIFLTVISDCLLQQHWLLDHSEGNTACLHIWASPLHSVI
jgi:hypothetical protein